MSKIILISGPTASGKSEFAVKIAKKVNGEIINADSMQIYKEIKILNTRPDKNLTKKVKHHLYGFVSVKTKFSVGKWIMLANKLIKKANDEDWGKEFLDLIVSIKSVKSIDDAINHIDEYSFGHTDGIISNINKNINTFVQRVNSSAVTVNASTRFNDGGEIGLGSEIAISTTKVSPRGPLGLEEITTYKWLIKGKGHTRV